MPDIYALLKQDHDEIKPLLQELVQGRQSHFEKAAFELKAHTEAEEETLYKSLEDRPETKEQIAEGYKQHRQADRLTQELMTAKAGSDDDFRTKAGELQEVMERHIEEEEGELFEKARKILGREQGEYLGERFGRSRHPPTEAATA
jgi:hemerythrin-like domain-containing protein